MANLGCQRFSRKMTKQNKWIQRNGPPLKGRRGKHTKTQSLTYLHNFHSCIPCNSLSSSFPPAFHVRSAGARVRRLPGAALPGPQVPQGVAEVLGSWVPPGCAPVQRRTWPEASGQEEGDVQGAQFYLNVQGIVILDIQTRSILECNIQTNKQTNKRTNERTN